VQGYKTLQLQYFFTAGPDEVKAWTILKGTKAPQAAGRIHTDFEKGFIMAEVSVYKALPSVLVLFQRYRSKRLIFRRAGFSLRRRGGGFSWSLEFWQGCLQMIISPTQIFFENSGF
jgi:hypothetical protein